MYKVTVSSKLPNGTPMVMTIASNFTYLEDAIERADSIVNTMRECKRTNVHGLVTEAATIIMVIE